MDFVKQLPLAARVAVPVILVVLVALVLFMTMRAPAMEAVITTADVDVLDASKKTLQAANVPFDTGRDETTGEFELLVAEDDSIAATTALKGSGLETRSTLAKKLKCPNEPGFTGTRATQTRYDNCQAAFNIQKMLLSAGALAANVTVTDVETGDLSGPQVEKNVFVQVFLRTSQKDDFPAESVANGIAISVASSIDRIIIQDDELYTLFGGAQGSKGGAAAAGSTASASGDCSNLTGFTDVAQKRFAVSRCFETEIGTQLTKILGGSDRFAISAQAEIDSTQSTTSSNRTIPGRATDISENSTKDGTSTANNKQTSIDTGSISTTESNPAGDLAKLKLTATLDANHVTMKQEQAVKAILRTYIDPARKDPAPVTTRIPFTAGAGSSDTRAEVERLAEEKQAAKQDAAKDNLVNDRPLEAAGTSKALLAIMAVVVIGLLTAILILWRRSTGMAAERARLQEEFRNEQRLLDNFAQQSPDEIARELEALLGAPATQEPSYR